MVYVGPKMKPEQQALYDALHRNGVMCMISVAPTHDRAKTEAEKIAGYQSEIGTPCFYFIWDSRLPLPALMKRTDMMEVPLG